MDIFYDDILIGRLNEQITLTQSEYLRSANILVLGDVLEHMIDPWLVLTQIHKFANPNAYILISIPTITSLLSTKRILSHGFRYKQSGIFDFTHLRFFSFSTIQEMIDLACPHRHVHHRRLICPDSVQIYQSRSSDGNIFLTDNISVSVKSVMPNWDMDIFTRGVVSVVMPVSVK